MPVARFSGGKLVISSPSRYTWLVVGLYNLAFVYNNIVLQLPLVSKKIINLSYFISYVISYITRVLPNFLIIFFRLIREFSCPITIHFPFILIKYLHYFVFQSISLLPYKLRLKQS